jgi:hypothetical protein
VLLLANGKETEDGKESPRGLLLVFLSELGVPINGDTRYFTIVPQPQGDPHTFLGNFRLIVAVLHNKICRSVLYWLDSGSPLIVLSAVRRLYFLLGPS